METDLGNVQCVRAADGWRAYIPAAYNASSGGHEVNITVNGEPITRSIIVLPKDFGTVDVEPEPDASDAANTQFRNAVWGQMCIRDSTLPVKGIRPVAAIAPGVSASTGLTLRQLAGAMVEAVRPAALILSLIHI